MDCQPLETEFEGRLRITTRVTSADAEEQGGFLYFHHIARAAVYWWLCDESDEAKLSDKVVVVCGIAEPPDPSEEPEVGVGGETSVRFPIAIRRLDPELSQEAMLAEAARVVTRKISEGAEDFAGLEGFHVAIDDEPVSDETAVAA